MSARDIESTAKALVADNKGILAADESAGTIEKRFKKLNLACTPDTRRAYRETLFTAPGLGEHISGVILFDETIRQKTASGTRMVKTLERQGIIAGIKVDKGAKLLAGFPGEKVTEGLDGLRERLAEYGEMGARFAKWRAVIAIGPNAPHRASLEANAMGLARYAALCQEAGLVPIVEPEVLMDGYHTIERHLEVTESILELVFRHLFDLRVRLEGMLLKPNMILAGKDCPKQAGVQEVARMTLSCLRRTVPAAVPGIVFLSGGQSDVMAPKHLRAINKKGKSPWGLSFSFGRALQDAAMKTWGGRAENAAAAQKALLDRARCNSAARGGN